MNMDEWQKKIEMDMDFALSRLLDVGEVKPMAMMAHKDGQMSLIALDLSSDEQKSRSFRFVRLLCTAHEATVLSIIGEMWSRTVARYKGESAAEYEERVTAVRPRDAEDRKEVVMVQIYYRDGDGAVRERSQSREILRGNDGKPTGLAPTEYPDAEVLYSEGEQTKLLPRTPPSPDKVRYARELLTRFGITGIPV